MFNKFTLILRPLVILTLVLTCFTATMTITQAISPSPSPSPSATPKPSPKVTPSPTLSSSVVPSPSPSPSLETTEKLKARIEKIVEEKKSQIMGAMSDLQQQQRRGFIGEVQRVTSETVTIKTTKGTQILVLNKDVAVTKGGKAITVDTIAVGDWAMVIGHTEDDTFLPDLINISSESLRPKNHLIALGTLNDVAKTTVTFLAKNQTDEQKLNILKASKFEDHEGNVLTFKDIKKEAQVLMIAQQDGSDWNVELIRVLSP